MKEARKKNYPNIFPYLFGFRQKSFKKIFLISVELNNFPNYPKLKNVCKETKPN